MEDIKAPGVGPVLGDAGEPAEFEWNGAPWKIGHPVQGAKDALERLVLKYAAANHEELRAVLPPARFAEKDREFDAAVTGGHWRTWGELWTAVTNGPDGDALLLLALLRGHHPGATLDDARAMWNDAPRQVRVAYAQVCPDFFRLLVACRPGNPEAKAAALAQATARVLALLNRAEAPGAPATPAPGTCSA